MDEKDDNYNKLEKSSSKEKKVIPKKEVKSYDLGKLPEHPLKKKIDKKENMKNNNYNDYTEKNLKNIKAQEQNINSNNYYMNSSSNYNNTSNNFPSVHPELKEMESGLLNKNMLNVNKDFVETKKEALRSLFRKEEQKKTPLLPDPIMSLNYIIGYSAKICE